MRLRLMIPTAAVMTMLSGSQVFAAPIVVSCGAGQRAVIRETYARGAPVTRVECVTARAYRPTTYRTRYATPYRIGRPHRSWGKTALVIGGGAGTGAGIGGIIRGKKGALIGGALGGGVASLYEGARRR
jgi:hypothetical protein